MSRKNIYLAIQNGIWMIQPAYVHASYGLIHKVLHGEQIFIGNEVAEEVEDLRLGAFAIDPQGAVAYGSRYNAFENALPGSTAVIGISGPIMKYDNCGDPGTKSYGALLNKASVHPNINSVVLVIDSPGGTVDGTQELAELVKNFKKPIVAFVDGLMASAAYWIGSSAKEVVANNNTAVIGSIGTMISFADEQPKMESEGWKFHYITADASADKNKEFLEARKGNYDLIKEKLNALNDMFLSAVKMNRAGKLDLKKENVLTGKTYLAEDALQAGLIDRIADFETAVDRAQALARGEDSSTENQNNPNMTKITLNASHAALLALSGATIPAGATSVDVELTGELTDKINSSLAVAASAAADKTTLETVSASLVKSEEKVTELQTALTEKARELSVSEAKVRALENPGSTNAGKQGNDNLGAGANDMWAEIDNLPHNKALDNNPLFKKD